MYRVGDHVFAHIRGHTPWPAIVSKVEIKGRTTFFHVDFFGSKKEKGQCSSNKLYAFEGNKKKFAVGKIMEDRDFALAIKEIENHIENRQNKSSIRSPMNFNSSTPNVSKLNLDSTASLHSSSLILVDKSVNTTFELDQTVQLEALTEKCIDLEKKAIQYEEQYNSFRETEKNLKLEIEHLKTINCELKQNLKALEIQQVSKPEQLDFQTQIVIEELRTKKLENENLKAASKILQEENNLLENKLENLKRTSSNCFRCFPPMPPLKKSQANLNRPAPSTTWTQVSPSNRKHRVVSQSPFSVPCSNGFEPLMESVDDTVEEEEHQQPGVLICGDSHGRDLAFHINKKHKTNNAYGFIKPGGRTRDILKTLKTEEVNMKDNDFMVLVCGTNDVARNEAGEVLEGISRTLNRYHKRQIILVDLPNRYDLVKWSCVNEEVKKTNASLKVLMSQHPNVTLVEASKAERHLHTRHGLHLNSKGKIWLAENIANVMINNQEVKMGAMKSPEQGMASSVTGAMKNSEQGMAQHQPPPPGTTSPREDSQPGNGQEPTPHQGP